MICDECNERVKTLHQNFYGAYCDKCVGGADDRAKKLYAELRKEELLSGPEFFTLKDFERFMMKFSLYFLDNMSRESTKRIRGTIPQLLQPVFMCLHLKDLVVEKMPLNYVSSMKSEGRDRFHYGATYQFKRDVPKAVVIKAMEDAGLIRAGEREEGS